MVAVGGGDVGVAVQAQQADGQAPQRRHDAGRVPGSDQGLVFLVGNVADPVQLVLYFPVAPDPGGQGGRVGRPVARDQADDLDGLLALPGDQVDPSPPGSAAAARRNHLGRLKAMTRKDRTAQYQVPGRHNYRRIKAEGFGSTPSYPNGYR